MGTTGRCRTGSTNSSLIDPKQFTEGIAFGRRLPDLQASLVRPSGEINHSGGPLWQIGEKYARMVGHHSFKFGVR